MRRSDVLFLAALVCAAVFLALEPLLSFSLFGSDTGEYYRLTVDLVTQGHLPIGPAYPGWGTAYPDFPGIFLLSGASSGALGIDPLSALIYVLPVVSAVSVVPLFLLFRRIFPNDRIAILGAGFATFAMPRMFSLAHPAPLAVGDALVIASLWMFVEGRRDVRWYLPLSLTGGALILTHHLSSYFFVASALGGLVVLELWRPRAWSPRFPTRELVFVAMFLIGLVAFWIGYAIDFAHVIAIGTGPISPAFFEIALLAGGPGMVLVLAAVIRWRRGRPDRRRRPFVRLPSDRNVVRDLACIVVAELVGVGALLLVPLPGSHQKTTWEAIVFFVPLLAVIALAAGTRRLVTTNRLGPLAVTWMLAVSLSAIFALSTGNPVLIPARHAEYLLIPLGLLTAIGLGRVIARFGDRNGRPAVLAASAAVLLLLAANAAIVYPPPSDFGGFQEGLTRGDATLWMWVGLGIPTGAAIASDHRVSSMLFGFDQNPATWDSTPALFTGTNRSQAMGELVRSQAPHESEVHPIDAVAVDGTMRTVGVALDPSELTRPMTAAASSWLEGAPFVPVYENGPEAVYWVDGPVTPAS